VRISSSKTRGQAGKEQRGAHCRVAAASVLASRTGCIRVEAELGLFCPAERSSQRPDCLKQLIRNRTGALDPVAGSRARRAVCRVAAGDHLRLGTRSRGCQLHHGFHGAQSAACAERSHAQDSTAKKRLSKDESPKTAELQRYVCCWAPLGASSSVSLPACFFNTSVSKGIQRIRIPA